MIDQLIFTYKFNLEHLEQQVGDLSDDQMVQQPHGLVNHPKWIIGHLASASNYVAKVLGLESTFPAAWEDPFKTGGVPSGDASIFPSKDQLLTELTSQHERVSAAITQVDAALFGQVFPDEEFRDHFPTIGNFCAYLMTAHEGNHIGQLATWRRAMNLASGD